jgi:hypothetical protein
MSRVLLYVFNHDVVMESSEGFVPEKEWTYLFVSIEDNERNKDTTFTLSTSQTVSDEVYTKSNFTYVDTSAYRHYVGGVLAMRTMYNSFFGFIYELELSQSSDQTHDPSCGGCSVGICPKSRDCLSECAWYEYETPEGECRECLSSCGAGCVAESTCNKCHPSCKGLCSGFGADDCISVIF